MKTKRTLATLVGFVAFVAMLPGGAAAPAPGFTFTTPTAGHPSVYRWTGAVLQSPISSSDVASPTSPASCGTTGLCQDIPLTVPAGLKTSTLYVRIAWTHPVWKEYLYVTSPDGSKVYPASAKQAETDNVDATQCDIGSYEKGCGNESSLPIDEVVIPNPAPGLWKVRVSAVNIHDERYTGMASLTASRPMQYIKESLTKLMSHLTRSQRVNIVFAGWKPTASELAELRANLPDQYIPAVVSKQGADGNGVGDLAGQVSGLVQHQPSHYTGTDPTNSAVIPSAVQPFFPAVPYFEPMKFDFSYHFLAADDTYTKDLFAAAKAATQLNHDPGQTGVYATSLSLPKNYKTLYLTKYNAAYGHFRGTGHVVTDTQTWDLVDAFKVEDWIQNSRFNVKYNRSFTDILTGSKTSASFINPDPSAIRDPHWNGNGSHSVNVDRTPQGAERGVTFIFMDTFTPSYASNYFRPDHYHYWGSFNHITDPDTHGGDEIDDARGWGGRYRFYFQDLGSAPSFYERENWLREEVVAQDGSAGFDPPIWQYRNDPTWNGQVALPADPTGLTRAGGSTLGQVLGWDINQGIAFKYIGSYLYRPVPADYFILATNNWIDHYSQPSAGGFYAINFNKLYKTSDALSALRSAIPYATFQDGVPAIPDLSKPQLLGCAKNHQQVIFRGTPLESAGLRTPTTDASCTKSDPRQYAIEEGKNAGALGNGPDMGVDVDILRDYIDHNRSKYAPLIDGAFTVPVLNVYFEKVYNVAIPLVVGGIAEGTTNGDGWGQVDNLNERSVWKGAIDCAHSSQLAPACTGAGPFSNARALTYIVQHESAHLLGLHHPHDGTVSVEKANGPAGAGSPFGNSKWHYYYEMNKWQYDYTASPTTYGHTYGTYEVVDQDRLMYGHTAEYLKQAQDWLADAYFLEGAAGMTSPSAHLQHITTVVMHDRALATVLFQRGDYLHAQYAMRNAVYHAKGFLFAPVQPHLMSLSDAAKAAAEPMAAQVSDGHEIFVINPQAVYGSN